MLAMSTVWTYLAIVLKVTDASDAQENILQRNAINQEIHFLNVYTMEKIIQQVIEDA